MFFNLISNMFQSTYVPPCQRDPYYEDPRDVKPDDISKTIYMSQCVKCGTFFVPENTESLCSVCRK